ncbi:MAG: NAD(P)-dependent oxidoreductase [Byssovorax sp.]
MKIVVLGASGGCGKHLVSQARDRGHEVTAAVRGAGYVPPAGVTVLRGDLADIAFLREAVRGKEAVLSALGLRLSSIAPWGEPEVPDFLSKSTPAIAAAMKAEGTRRIIAISAGGVGDSRAKVPAFFRAFIATTSLRRVYPELERMERALFASGLDVCIARPTGLTDGPVTGVVKVVEGMAGRATISRADVAAWMLGELESPAYSNRAPMITVTGAP